MMKMEQRTGIGTKIRIQRTSLRAMTTVTLIAMRIIPMSVLSITLLRRTGDIIPGITTADITADITADSGTIHRGITAQHFWPPRSFTIPGIPTIILNIMVITTVDMVTMEDTATTVVVAMHPLVATEAHVIQDTQGEEP